jgi:hypothetical protein
MILFTASDYPFDIILHGLPIAMYLETRIAKTKSQTVIIISKSQLVCPGCRSGLHPEVFAQTPYSLSQESDKHPSHVHVSLLNTIFDNNSYIKECIFWLLWIQHKMCY